MFRDLAERIGANRAVVALSIARLGDALGNSILMIIIPLYIARLHVLWFHLPEMVRVGIVISLYGVVSSAVQPFMGALGDRLGRRKPLILGGLFLMGTATLAFLVAGRWEELLLIRAVQGVGVALTITASMAFMAKSTEKRTRGGSMGVYTTMRMVGFAVGPLIGGFLHDRFGYGAAFAASAGFIFLGMIVVQVWIKEDEPEDGKRADRSFRFLDRSLLEAGIIGLGVATFLMAGNFTMMVTLEKQFNARLEQSAFVFGLAFSALMVSRLLFQLPLGRLSDRFGRKPFIIGGLILMAPATALLGYVGTSVQLIGVRLLQGLGSAAIAAPCFALAGDLAKPGGEGRQMSVLTMGFSLGLALGPIFAGAVAVHAFSLPFLIGGGLSLVGAWVVSHYVPETVKQRTGTDHPT